MNFGTTVCNNFKFGAIQLSKIMFGTELVWQIEEPAGNTIFTRGSITGSNPEYGSGSGDDFTFLVPEGFTDVTICLVGGGGGGREHSADPLIGGGSAGGSLSQIYSVTAGEVLIIHLGSGGGEFANGTATTCGTLTGSGGAAASSTIFPSGGDAPYFDCVGTQYHNGGVYCNGSGGGPGEGSPFGSGGDGGGEGCNPDRPAKAGGLGAGGGTYYGGNHPGLPGGNGQVIVSWS